LSFGTGGNFGGNIKLICSDGRQDMRKNLVRRLSLGLEKDVL